MSVRVALVEDDRRYLAALRTLFAQTSDFAVVDAFASGEAALDRLTELLAADADLGWDLVLMDLALPGADGIACTRRLKRLAPSVTVVVVTVSEQAEVVLEAICAGADGYLTKRTAPEALLAELRSVRGGGAPLSAGVARTVLALLRRQTDSRGRAPDADPPAVLSLTPREQDVLRLLVQGLSYQRVGDRLGISIDTVRSHVRRVYSKLQVHTVAEAVSRALRQGLV